MDQLMIAKSLNEWMRRYVEEPSRFAAEFQTVNQYLTEQANGVEPSYGAVGAAYLADCWQGLQPA